MIWIWDWCMVCNNKIFLFIIFDEWDFGDFCYFSNFVFFGNWINLIKFEKGKEKKLLIELKIIFNGIDYEGLEL